MGDDDTVLFGEPGNLIHGNLQVDELLLDGSGLPLADERVAAQGDEEIFNLSVATMNM